MKERIEKEVQRLKKYIVDLEREIELAQSTLEEAKKVIEDYEREDRL